MSAAYSHVRNWTVAAFIPLNLALQWLISLNLFHFSVLLSNHLQRIHLAPDPLLRDQPRRRNHDLRFRLSPLPTHREDHERQAGEHILIFNRPIPASFSLFVIFCTGEHIFIFNAPIPASFSLFVIFSTLTVSTKQMPSKNSWWLDFEPGSSVSERRDPAITTAQLNIP